MSRTQDRLALLTTFARIAERGSISAAARDLGMSQASASRQLRDLEDRVGAVLARRTTHALSLTQTGERCLADARALIDGWDALVESARGDEGVLDGALKVVAPVALGQLHLAEAAIQFQHRHPGLSMTWLLDDAPIRFAEIGCDLWIKIGTVPDDRLIVRSAGEVERLIVASPDFIRDHPAPDPQALPSAPCAALEPFDGASITLRDAHGATASVTAPVGIATNNILAARKAALLGIGFAVMPRWFVEDHLPAGALADVLPGWRAPSLQINLAYLPARRQPRRLTALLSHMIEAIAEIPGINAA